MNGVPPWSALAPDQRRLTVAEVRARCASLPPARQRRLDRDVAAPRPAATLVPVVDHGGEAAVVVTRRPATMTYHRGDWVFPGGRVDPELDASAADAARREAREELGVPDERLDIVGELDTHGPIVTGFVIRVFVGIVHAGTELAPDPREVEAVLALPLRELMADGVYRQGGPAPDHEPGPSAMSGPARPLAGIGRGRGLRFFALGGDELLWGTQAEILYNLLEHLVTR